MGNKNQGRYLMKMCLDDAKALVNNLCCSGRSTEIVAPVAIALFNYRIKVLEKGEQ